MSSEKRRTLETMYPRNHVPCTLETMYFYQKFDKKVKVDGI